MHELPELPFAQNALEPFLSAETFEYHHGKHHAGYVNKLNAAIDGSEFQDQSLEEIINNTRGVNQGLFNNAAQHFNHSFFWNCLSPDSQSPSESLVTKLSESFESVDAFKEAFSKQAATLFGSGWAWLVQHSDGTLAIEQYKDADTPFGTDKKPLLTLDVWEHAYYIDYKNARAEFIEKFWDYVNWAWVEEQMR